MRTYTQLYNGYIHIWVGRIQKHLGHYYSKKNTTNLSVLSSTVAIIFLHYGNFWYIIGKMAINNYSIILL